MINTRDVNIQMITTVARRLGNLREKVVFVGGCATGLFITDTAMPEVRVTKDVDVIIDIATRMEKFLNILNIYRRIPEISASHDYFFCWAF